MLAAEVRVRFNKLPRMGQGLEAAVDAGLREVADAAGQASGPATPVDTGELKSTARTEQVGRMRWRRYWPASYAAYQNFGTSRGVPARHFAETGVRSVAGRAGGIVAARVERLLMRWGSIAAEKFLRARIVAAPLPAGVKVYPGSLLPQSAALPAIHFWREAATDQGPIGDEIVKEELRYIVLAVTTGHDVEALLPVADPMHDAIHGVGGKQDGVRVHIRRVGELPLDPRVYDQDEPLVRLGGVYAVEVME